MKKALGDVTVLDLSAHLAGPFCTMQLADLGAEVIKIEPPRGDASRTSGAEEAKGEAPYFLSVNRNKKGIVLNLKTEKGLGIFKELVKISDVVVENFRPGVTERLGVDYETLKKINPKIVYASISGFGQTGPYSKRSSFDQVAQAMSGMMNLSGYGGPPSSTAGSISDTIPALYAAVAILAALHYAKRTGFGQYIDIAQVHSTTAAMPIAVQTYLITGDERYHENPNPGTEKTFPMKRFRGTYQTLEGYVSFNALFHFMEIFVKLVAEDIPEVLDDWTENQSLSKKSYEKIVEWIKNKTTDELEALLERAKIPFGRVLSLPELEADPQAEAREVFVKVEHPLGFSFKMVSSPIKMSETPPTIERAPPTLGQDADDILSKHLGYGSEEIAKLKEEGVIK